MTSPEPRYERSLDTVQDCLPRVGCRSKFEYFIYRHPIFKFAIYIFVSAVFLWAGSSIVIQRNSQTQIEWYKISPDAEHYISMTKNIDVELPFSRRILVPWIASGIPAQPETSLRIITYFSLFSFYFISFIFLNSLKFPFVTSVAAIFSVFCSTAHLLMFQNPHIVDAFCHLCIVIMVFSTLRSKAFYFCTAAVVGVLSHEMAMFAVPSFLTTGRWRFSLSILALIYGVFALSHVAIGGWKTYTLPTFKSAIFVEAYLAWGLVWLMIGVGVVFCSVRYFLALGGALLLLFSSALLASVLSRGAVRMFTVMMPIAVICSAYFLTEIRNLSKSLFWIWTGFCGVAMIFSLPTIFTHSLANSMVELEDFYWRLKFSILIYHIAGASVGLWIIFSMGQQWRISFAEKWHSLRNQMSSARRFIGC